MIRIAIALAAAMLATSASATSSDVVITAGPQIGVSYAGLDLKSAAGRELMVGRIRAAASSLCNDFDVDPLDVRLKRMECYRVAVADGVSKIDEIAD